MLEDPDTRLRIAPISDNVTVERKEFDGFLAENQKLIDRSHTLMGRVD